MFKLWKIPAEFSQAFTCTAAGPFISICSSRLWAGAIRNKTEAARLGHICTDPHTNTLPSLRV